MQKMPRPEQPVITPEALARWCACLVDGVPSSILFEAGHLSAVVGVALEDGRRVVVKARPNAERLTACALVQGCLWRAGYPCPELIAGPVVLDGLAINIEAYLGPGSPASGRDAPGAFACPLARLIALAPPPDSLPKLSPSPAWVAWDNDRADLWPTPDDRNEDLNLLREPAWIDQVALRARNRLARDDLPPAVGHADWWSENLLWRDGVLVAVLDWDSVAALPEAALAGVGAAIYKPSLPSVEESAAFLEAYQRARGRRFSPAEIQVSWAAGLWTRAFDAKKESVDGTGSVQASLAAESEHRLNLAQA